MSWSSDFPRLRPDNHRVTSPATLEYNCIAWAVEDTEHWWEPGRYWLPENWPKDDCGVGALEQAFLAMGYESCDEMDASLESGLLKVALYGSVSSYTNAARQLPSGKWTSKLGKDVDIEHDAPEDVTGGVYGEVMGIMKRRGPLQPHPDA
jgi:hypothetical protein